MVVANDERLTYRKYHWKYRNYGKYIHCIAADRKFFSSLGPPNVTKSYPQYLTVLPFRYSHLFSTLLSQIQVSRQVTTVHQESTCILESPGPHNDFWRSMSLPMLPMSLTSALSIATLFKIVIPSITSHTEIWFGSWFLYSFHYSLYPKPTHSYHFSHFTLFFHLLPVIHKSILFVNPCICVLLLIYFIWIIR